MSNKSISLKMKISVLTLITVLTVQFFAQDNAAYRDIRKSWFEGDISTARDILKGSKNSVDIYNLAYLQILSANYSEAERLANLLRDTFPERVNHLYANIYFAQQLYYQAIPFLEKNTESDPDDLYTILKLGRSYLATGQNQKARAFLVEKVDDFEDERLYDLIAETLLNENKIDEALVWLYEAEKLYPDLSVIWHLIEVFYESKNVSKLVEYGLKYSTLFSGSSRDDRLAEIFSDFNLKNDFSPININFKNPLRLNIGEYLKYDVSYGFITLGEVIVQVQDTLTYRGKSCYQIEYQANTISGLPFFTIRNRYVAYQDKNNLIGYKSMVYIDEGDGLYLSSYIMDYPAHRLNIYKIANDGIITFAQRYLPNAAVDAMALLFYARNQIKNKKSITVTTIINDSYRTTNIFFKNMKENISVLNQEIISEEVYAKANFTGLAGMTGDVWGWFVDTENACVPAIGKARIILGSVTLTLVKWRE